MWSLLISRYQVSWATKNLCDKLLGLLQVHDLWLACASLIKKCVVIQTSLNIWGSSLAYTSELIGYVDCPHAKGQFDRKSRFTNKNRMQFKGFQRKQRNRSILVLKNFIQIREKKKKFQESLKFHPKFKTIKEPAQINKTKSTKSLKQWPQYFYFYFLHQLLL